MSLILFSCGGKDEREILYSPHDAEHSLLAAHMSRECIKDATIFNVFETGRVFTNSTFSVGDIFKISQDTDNAFISYVKINTITATDMTLTMISGTADYSKNITFSQADYDLIVDFLEGVACNSDYDQYFSTSGLTSSSAMSFNWSRDTILTEDDDDKPETYRYIDESLVASTDYPLFMFFYNGTKKQEYVVDKEIAAQTETSKITITQITQTVCDADPTCDGIDVPAEVTRNCLIEVDSSLFSSQVYNVTPLKFEAGSDADCKFLGSASIEWDK
jgi:hypothetical protein